MPKFQFTFTGRKAGALGTHSTFTAIREADTERMALILLYDEFEHIFVSRASQLPAEPAQPQE